ncbi:MAG: DUF3536 domain-containing protein [Dehalococcoidales bacterium]|nr:DUF3536 domain-containing protein [Dehalococcoidales bacterium]
MEQYVCIHGHFYQPPRENPWLESIELQDSAYPYHDWNERITAECYAPNAAARILGKSGLISKIVSNYASISFNFGPTLLAWMAGHSPETYQAIIAADQESARRFSGHGSAMAQAYSHMIMPLANERDRLTQVLWGIRDFESRFGRKPEGMWLPETAVDLATLDVMAKLGIAFTVLAPHQAKRVRAAGSKAWDEISEVPLDVTAPYRLELPSGRSIAVFFYHGPIARAVAFEGLLSSGEQFSKRLVSAFQKGRRPQLVHIATDGETYGHHHRYGDMALAYALRYIESNNLARLTNYGQYLEKYPPTREVEINENTSWSCAHGIEHWRSNCGCNSGAHPDWNQEWRAPLRESLDWLRDNIAPKYEEKAQALLTDPWAARDRYIDVVLDRSVPNVERFLSENAVRHLNEAEKITALKLLELQRHAMLMFTSDGWFFDELSGIEPVQIMQYATRAMQLAEDLLGESFEPGFLDILGQAQSNIPELGNGRRVWEQYVKPARLDMSRIAARFAISSLFEETRPDRTKVDCYLMDTKHYQTFTGGNSRLVVGRTGITSEITRDSDEFSFAVLYYGRRRVSAGVGEYTNEETYQDAIKELTGTFTSANFPEVIRLIGNNFTRTYGLNALSRDEQRKLMDGILESSLKDIQSTYRQLYSDYYPASIFLSGAGKPILIFHSAAQVILNIELRRALTAEVPDLEYIDDIMERVKSWRVELDNDMLSYRFRQALGRTADKFAASPDDLSLMGNLGTGVTLARSIPFGVDLWEVQNVCYRMLGTVRTEYQRRAQLGDETAVKWLNQFLSLAKQLSIEAIEAV